MGKLGFSVSFALQLLVTAPVAAVGQSCCALLQIALPQRETITPASSLYTELVEGRWSETAIRAPACVFRPESANDVSQAVRVLAWHDCKFAVKSGGHMPVVGANSIDGGVSIDLGLLNRTELAGDRSFVRLGTGLTWGEAYSTFESDNIVFPGGVCGTTGVGGVSLGGGQSLFQPRVGWVVDNVLNYEVVLATGEIVNANKTHLPDLFKALKGGGNNFGIVTQVTLAAITQESIWAGQIVVPDVPTVRAAALELTTNFTVLNNEDPNAGLQMVFIKTANGSAIIDVAVAATDGNPDSPLLKPYTELQPQILNTVHSRSLANTILEFDAVSPPGFRQIGATISFVNDLAAITAVQEAFDTVHDTLKDIPYLDWILFYDPQPRVTETFSTASGGNVLGLQNEENDLIVTWLVPRWTDAQYDSRVYQAAHDWVKAANNATAALGKSHPFVYLNFALGDQKPFCTYGAANIAFLRATASKYDPKGVFQRLLPGGFKVFEQC